MRGVRLVLLQERPVFCLYAGAQGPGGSEGDVHETRRPQLSPYCFPLYLAIAAGGSVLDSLMTVTDLEPRVRATYNSCAP